MTEVLPCTCVEQGTGSHTNNALSRNVDGQSLLTPEDRKGNNIHYSPPGRKRDFLSRLFRRHKKRKVVQLGKQRDDDGLGKKREAMMLVSVLIATLAYQASLNPPGGFWQDDKTGNAKAGTAINSSNVGFQGFMIGNTVALFASLVVILCLTSAKTLKWRHLMWMRMALMWISVFSVALSFFCGTFIILGDASLPAIGSLTCFGLGFMVLFAVVLLLNAFIGLKKIC